MKYSDLTVYFTAFHMGKISKIELAAAICMWQRAGGMI